MNTREKTFTHSFHHCISGAPKRKKYSIVPNMGELVIINQHTTMIKMNKKLFLRKNLFEKYRAAFRCCCL
jgi:hypothetical protein